MTISYNLIQAVNRVKLTALPQSWISYAATGLLKIRHHGLSETNLTLILTLLNPNF